MSLDLVVRNSKLRIKSFSFVKLLYPTYPMINAPNNTNALYQMTCFVLLETVPQMRAKEIQVGQS